MLTIARVTYNEKFGEKEEILEITKALSELFMQEGYTLSAFFDCDDEIPEECRKYTYRGEIKFLFPGEGSCPTVKIVREGAVIAIGLSSNSSKFFSQIFLSIKDVMPKLCATLNKKYCACEYEVVDFGLKNISSNIQTPSQNEKTSIIDLLNLPRILPDALKPQKLLKKMSKRTSQ